MTWLLLAGAIASEISGTMALRVSEGLRHRAWVLPVLALYTAAFLQLSLALRQGLAVGVAYGVWAASGVALTAVLARYLFGDPLTRRTGAGLALIAGSVLLVELGARSPR